MCFYSKHKYPYLTLVSIIQSQYKSSLLPFKPSTFWSDSTICAVALVRLLPFTFFFWKFIFIHWNPLKNFLKSEPTPSAWFSPSLHHNKSGCCWKVWLKRLRVPAESHKMFNWSHSWYQSGCVTVFFFFLPSQELRKKLPDSPFLLNIWVLLRGCLLLWARKVSDLYHLFISFT